MHDFIAILKLESYKIITSKSLWIVAVLVVVIQPLIAIVSAKEIVAIGLNATPASNPDLAQAFPPVEYLGFYDLIPFGLLPMVVFGSFLGANEYSNHSLRTTLLCCANRKKNFLSKLVNVFLFSVLISIIAIYLTIAFTHITLNDYGLNPFILSPITWRFILYATIEWVLLTLIAFAIGMLSRNSIVSLLFLIPQIYGLANFFALKWTWGIYLPIVSGQMLRATPTDSILHEPIQGGLILSVWFVLLALLARYSLIRRDLGGRY